MQIHGNLNQYLQNVSAGSAAEKAQQRGPDVRKKAMKNGSESNAEENFLVGEWPEDESQPGEREPSAEPDRREELVEASAEEEQTGQRTSVYV
jgi:predicted nucleic acid-binding Zn ribbon protein